MGFHFSQGTFLAGELYLPHDIPSINHDKSGKRQGNSEKSIYLTAFCTTIKLRINIRKRNAPFLFQAIQTISGMSPVRAFARSAKVWKIQHGANRSQPEDMKVASNDFCRASGAKYLSRMMHQMLKQVLAVSNSMSCKMSKRILVPIIIGASALCFHHMKRHFSGGEAHLRFSCKELQKPCK